MREQGEQLGGGSDLLLVAIAREIAVRGVAPLAETASVDFSVEVCEEEVLENGAIVGVAGVAVVVFEERGDLLLDEEFGSNKALLLEEPDEEQAGDEPDDMLLRTEGSGADLWESGELALQRLVSHFFQVRMEKGARKSDWGKRPLTPKMREYALNDVRYLLPLHKVLKKSPPRSGSAGLAIPNLRAARRRGGQKRGRFQQRRLAHQRQQRL